MPKPSVNEATSEVITSNIGGMLIVKYASGALTCAKAATEL